MTTELTATSQATLDEKKEGLVKDLKVVAGDADALLREAASSTAEGLASARTAIEGKVGEARSRLDTARMAMTSKARGAADATQEYVRENPWRIVGAFAVAGFITGFLLSRR